MVIAIEGSKNVGKSYLIGKSGDDSYKFPFQEYFKEFIAKDDKDTGNGSKEAFHFTTSFDVTLLSMIKANIIRPISTVLIDRSYLSNLVLGEIQGRITHEEGLKYIDWLAKKEILDVMPILYIDKKHKEDGRAVEKDKWEFLGYEQQKEVYEKYFKYLKDKYKIEPYRFINDFNGNITEMHFCMKIAEIEKTAFGKAIRNKLGLDSIFKDSFLDKIFNMD